MDLATALGRRAFLGRGSIGVGTAALAALLAPRPATAAVGLQFAPRARRVIWLTQSGAPSQLDLFDHKPGLAGEFVRDHALAVSGLLVPRLGGPSVRPYHPPGLYETMAPSSPGTVKTWVQDHGESLYRRSLYTFWKRSIPHPALLAFGTPFRETCTLQRPRSNTPLQALNLMNDETCVKASRFLAERMMTEANARLAHGFRLVLARPPSAEQLAILRRGHDRAR